MKPYIIQVIYPDQETEFSFIDNLRSKDEFKQESKRLKDIYKNKVKFIKITNKNLINNILS